MTNTEKIRAAIEAYAVKQEQEDGAAKKQQLIDAYIEAQNPVLWEELKSELRTLCESGSDAVILTEENANELRIQGRHNDEHSEISFDGNRYYISNFRSRSYLDMKSKDFGVLRCRLDKWNNAKLFPNPGFFWSPAYVAYLVLLRIVSGAQFIDPEALGGLIRLDVHYVHHVH